MLALLTVGVLLAAQGQPAPQPFPKPAPPPAAPTAPRPSAPPADPVAAGSRPAEAPTEATLGVAIYPSAQFITSYDAGRGQRFYIFGSTASFVDLVGYYRTVLKQRGFVVYEVPATHQFEFGRFDEKTMAFPPSVTIKDFESEVSKGYPNPKRDGMPARFPTIIQIVPAPAGSAR